MLEKFKRFEIKNTKVIYGGTHAASDGVPADNLTRLSFNMGIARDHGDNDGILPDGAGM